MKLAVAIVAASMVMGCTTITEVREIECEDMEVFWQDSTSVVLDSVRFVNCTQPSWDGLTVRRKR